MASREIGQILQLWSGIEATGAEAVLGTVVKIQGSSYRLPGARLLLTQDGRRAGSVSGGCLEEDLARKAWWFTENGPSVRRYDTTAEGEIAGQYGLGCNGIIHVRLERVSAGNCQALNILRQVVETRQPAVISHEISSDGSERFVETVLPPLRLLIFGAGDDAIPLTDFASHLGWETHVFDGRPHYARREKFPHATNVAVRAAGSGTLLPIDQRTVAVIMSHSLTQDQENLRELVPFHLPYLGVLGPRKRTEEILHGLAPAASVFGPMGLDLGADGPEQVALAVVSEIQAVLNGRVGGQLRHLQGPIHQCA